MECPNCGFPNEEARQRCQRCRQPLQVAPVAESRENLSGVDTAGRERIPLAGPDNPFVRSQLRFFRGDPLPHFMLPKISRVTAEDGVVRVHLDLPLG